MRLLVLGGTSFVGRHLVDIALERGHRVTLFNRGRTNATLFPDAEHRYGDRSTGDYAVLESGSWDATIDVSAYVPRHVDQALDALADRSGHYVLVSSISAYDHRVAGRDEDSPRWPAPAPETEDITPETYGPLKSACERCAEGRLGTGAVSIVRPTFVVGPHDPTDRFTYWVRVVSRGGRVPLAWPREPVQVIDARDLGAFLLTAAASRHAGCFDAVGPHAPLEELLREISVPDRPVTLVDVGEDRLRAAGISLPMVDGDPVNRPLMTRPGERAAAAGLSKRPLRQTARDVLAWDVSRGSPPLRVGPGDAERQALLDDASRDG